MRKTANKSEKITFRLEKDQLRYIEKLAEERDHVGKSRVVRQIIDFHEHLMLSPLSRILKEGKEHPIEAKNPVKIEVYPTSEFPKLIQP